MRKILSVTGLVAVTLASIGVAKAEPITHFSNSISFVQASSSGFSTGPDYYQEVFNPNGGLASTSRSYSFDEGDASTSASANLSSGELKALAETTASGDGGSFSSFARADFGDSFRTYSNNSPFSWNASQANFTFDVSGLVSLNDADNGSVLGLTIMSAGALDAYARWLNGEDTYDAWSSEVIAEYAYGLGPGVDQHPWTTDILTEYPDSVSAGFTPGQDFDWVLTLISHVSINGDFAAPDAHGLADFSNTVGVTYNGPEGTTTYSASEVFPGTLALSNAPVATRVPEPGTLALFGFGLAGMVCAGRRRRR